MTQPSVLLEISCACAAGLAAGAALLPILAALLPREPRPIDRSLDAPRDRFPADATYLYLGPATDHHQAFLLPGVGQISLFVGDELRDGSKLARGCAYRLTLEGERPIILIRRATPAEVVAVRRAAR